MIGPAGVAYATAIMTLLIVIFAAVLPKTYALAFADRAALFVAPIMRVIIVLLTPFTAAIQFIVRQFLKLTPSRPATMPPTSSPRTRRSAAPSSSRPSAAPSPRATRRCSAACWTCEACRCSTSWCIARRCRPSTSTTRAQKVIDDVVKSQHTRIPLWKDEPDNIVGVLHTKDLLVELARNGWDAAKLDLASLAAQPWFVPDTTSVTDQLNEFLKRKAQLALVVDEYGEVQGLITLEDILEEIVGQIADEHDVGDIGIRVQADGSVNVDGTVAVRDLNRQMDWDLPDEEATTIAGLVIHEAQTIPEPGQIFTFYDYRFEILRKNRNKITAIRIKPLSATAKRPRTTHESDAMEAG